MSTPVIHIAGEVIQIGSQQRQRCSWCGAVLDDFDLSRMGIMVPDDQQPPPATPPIPSWPTGGLVAVDGGMKWTVPHDDGDPLPDEACAQLPHDVTGHTTEVDRG